MVQARIPDARAHRPVQLRGKINTSTTVFGVALIPASNIRLIALEAKPTVIETPNNVIARTEFDENYLSRLSLTPEQLFLP